MKKLALTVPTYNWPKAFLLYSEGITLEEISRTEAIPLTTLCQVSRTQQWNALQAKMVRSPELHGDTKAQMAVIKANREQNFKIACDLRDDLVAVIERMRSAEGLELEKQWHNRGLVTRAMVPMSIADRVQLGSYAKIIAELTYRSLGDKEAADGGAQAPGDSQSQPPSITIILPGLIAKPRKELSDNDLRESVTLDLRDPVPQLKSAKTVEPTEVPQSQ